MEALFSESLHYNKKIQIPVTTRALNNENENKTLWRNRSKVRRVGGPGQGGGGGAALILHI